MKRRINVYLWREFKRRIRVCRLFFRWICRVRERSFELRILWFDFDSFSTFCVWVCCVFCCLFDFKKLREWNSIVWVVIISRKRRIWNWKKNRFYFLFFCLHFHQFVDRKSIRFCLFRLWFKFCDFVWEIVCFFEFEKERNRSNKRDRVSWWKDCYKKRCFESLWNE